MNLTLKNTTHIDALRIGVSFTYNPSTNNKIRFSQPTYSKTNRCWHFYNTTDTYGLLHDNFDDIIINFSKKPEHASITVAGPKSRDLPPIDTNDMPNNTVKQVSKLPASLTREEFRGHKAYEKRLAQKQKMQLFGIVGGVLNRGSCIPYIQDLLGYIIEQQSHFIYHKKA